MLLLCCAYGPIVLLSLSINMATMKSTSNHVKWILKILVPILNEARINDLLVS